MTCHFASPQKGNYCCSGTQIILVCLQFETKQRTRCTNKADATTVCNQKDYHGVGTGWCSTIDSWTCTFPVFDFEELVWLNYSKWKYYKVQNLRNERGRGRGVQSLKEEVEVEVVCTLQLTPPHSSLNNILHANHISFQFPMFLPHSKIYPKVGEVKLWFW